MRLVLLLLALIFLLGENCPQSRADEDDAIATAVKKGVEYLQSVHRQAPNYSGGRHGMGTATLAGLALLESGVGVDDPSVRNILSFVRGRALQEAHTYEVSLTIMLLDRVGDPADQPIIQVLGIRLMAGQGPTGGWTYDCPYPLDADGEAKLRQAIDKESKLVNNPNGAPAKKQAPKVVVRDDVPGPAVEPSAPGAANKGDLKTLPLNPSVAKWAALINQQHKRNGGFTADGDNSNTQFAALGLWCARKHGVPCDPALALLHTRFRSSQEADGGWSYIYRSGGGSTATMTCAGLIGLAVAHGAKLSQMRTRSDAPNAKEAKNAADDEAIIKSGLKCLGQYITIAKGGPPEGKVRPASKRRRFRPDQLSQNLYLLWSVERVAVIFGLDTIGNHDWYAWGSDALLELQGEDGGWPGAGYHGASGEISTSFALLFLSRANVARDLTVVLQGKVKDPGVATLRGGGDPPLLVKSPVATAPPKTDASLTTEKNGEAGELDPEQLKKELLRSSADSQAQLLAKLRDSKGSTYTEALARAAAATQGEFQREVRGALARRLTRMTAATLRSMLRDDDVEIRAAAASACGLKESWQFIPDLITALEDRENLVVSSAASSLRQLSKKDFGPAAPAGADEKAKAVAAWRAWWKEQSK